MAAPRSIGRPAHMLRIVKSTITVAAIVLTSLGAIAMNDERALAGDNAPAAMSIPEQLADGARDILAPLASWLAEPGEGPGACSQEASARP